MKKGPLEKEYAFWCLFFVLPKHGGEDEEKDCKMLPRRRQTLH